MWREFSLINSYTCEASFCGPSQGICKGFHFSIKMLLDMGRDFCRTLALYSEADASYYRQILTELQYDFNKAQGETAARGHDGQDGAGQGAEKGGRGSAPQLHRRRLRSRSRSPAAAILTLTAGIRASIRQGEPSQDRDGVSQSHSRIVQLVQLPMASV